MGKKQFVHPYIPNSVPETKRAMMEAVGISSLEELFSEIPEPLRFCEKLDLPEPVLPEYELRRHLEETLEKNISCREYTSFLGGGCWQHYVPAVVDEVVNRAEFVTAYCGGTYSDLGKYQARFEFYSMMAEMLNVDAVSEPIYDWGTAAGFAVRMAARITGKNEVLIPKNISPERLAQIRTLCQPESMPGHIKITLVDFNLKTGKVDLQDLQKKISPETAAVYLEVPSYLGVVDENCFEVGSLVKPKNIQYIVGVDPISLGILVPPGDYGADIICGDLQPLGIHMLCGGGQSGFIAFRDEEKYVSECPLAIYTIVETAETGKYGYTEILPERTSYEARDKAKDWVATASGLWTIGAAVYMALMGPRGMREIGETILKNAAYLKKKLNAIPGLEIPFTETFKEFVVNFDQSGKSVSEINKRLLDYGIFGGLDLSRDFPEIGNVSLYCVTEMHTLADLKKLIAALEEVLSE